MKPVITVAQLRLSTANPFVEQLEVLLPSVVTRH
jgi:hypothetical protein